VSPKHQEDHLQALVSGVSLQDLDEQIVSKLYRSLIWNETFYGRLEATIVYMTICTG
jgi:hypothetical protein